jgi:hypothetical protein
MAKASAEMSIEKNKFLLNKYQHKLKTLSSVDINDAMEREKIKKQ